MVPTLTIGSISEGSWGPNWIHCSQTAHPPGIHRMTSCLRPQVHVCPEGNWCQSPPCQHAWGLQVGGAPRVWPAGGWEAPRGCWGPCLWGPAGERGGHPVGSGGPCGSVGGTPCGACNERGHPVGAGSPAGGPPRGPAGEVGRAPLNWDRVQGREERGGPGLTSRGDGLREGPQQQRRQEEQQRGARRHLGQRGPGDVGAVTGAGVGRGEGRRLRPARAPGGGSGGEPVGIKGRQRVHTNYRPPPPPPARTPSGFLALVIGPARGTHNSSGRADNRLRH